jgi:hypothetical protein
LKWENVEMETVSIILNYSCIENNFIVLELLQLAKWFSPYGNVDVKAYGQNKALVATSNHYW